MKITKYGHCCLLIEDNGVRLLTDPGNMSDGQNFAENIDVVLITHEHQDHLHLPSLKLVLQNNPEAKVVTNASVGKLLDKEVIPYTVVGEGQTSDAFGIKLEGFGHLHEEIYRELGQVENTSYFIGPRLFYPGDAFYDVKAHDGRQVEILGLPTAGPWMKIKEAIDYMLAVAPKTAFPVHDAVSKNPDFANSIIGNAIKDVNIDFNVLEIGKETEF
jgi:L-ascorbate metabolism protein UlaG (beta-lactamase superfamily)